MERTTLHIVGGTSRSRAEQARTALALGHHAEVYADLAELLHRAPADGIVLADDPRGAAGVREIIDRLGERGICLPLVCTAERPDLEWVVAAIRAGALDYLALPLEANSLARRLVAIAAETPAYASRRHSEVMARRRVVALSRREREVLALLSQGRTNKEIALSLTISPRTVEIHRGNMMGKLSANHTADAVRTWIAAGLDSPPPDPPRESIRPMPFVPAAERPKRRQRQ